MGQVMLLDRAIEWRRSQGEASRIIVFTNGVFDLLHVGHARYLGAARALGDALMVGVNGDASTRALKPGRPIVPEDERAELVAALAMVDVVVVFQETDAGRLVAALQPDIYVKGGDWGREGGPQPPEAEVVASYGGRVAYLPYVKGRSTTELIQRITERGGHI